MPQQENLSVLIDGIWQDGPGQDLRSINPANGSVVWSAREGDATSITDAVAAARRAQPAWEDTPLPDRHDVMKRFAELAEERRTEFAGLISAETGKPHWEALTEVSAVIGKVALSIDAHAERSPSKSISPSATLSHRPLGVIGILGPFNFPAHLPNGQIVPALLAGNAVVYKPSELTPAVAQFHVQLFLDAGLAPGLLNVVIGGRSAGAALVDAAGAGGVAGIAFTGSVATGRALHRALADRPEVLLALEMGGNNPLVVADYDDLRATVNIIIRSAFITAGQRCTCARRLYLPRTPEGDRLLDALVETTGRLRTGGPEDDPVPFLGPVVSVAAADAVRSAIEDLVDRGAQLLCGPGHSVPGTGFVRPAILAADGVALPDEEIFGPVLVVQRYDDLDEALRLASDTKFGLAAGFIGSQRADFELFQRSIRAGIVNWNTPTTGASGRLPFGGVGASGNHRPAGWTAADFCSYPVATVEYSSDTESDTPLIGLDEPADYEEDQE